MSAEDVPEYYATAKNMPILKELVKKGVYLTFNEFKNNQPSVISFSKKKMPKKKIYEITDEKDHAILNYFACYDGEKLAIAKHLADLFATNISQDNYGMYKVGNSFQFFEGYVRYTYTSGINQDFRSYVLVKVPRQVDMETGEIY